MQNVSAWRTINSSLYMLLIVTISILILLLFCSLAIAKHVFIYNNILFIDF